MRLLVTGGAGFIGSNFVKYWQHRLPGHSIGIMDKLTYAGSLGNLEDTGEVMHWPSDIAVAEQVDDGIECFRPKYVVHFAAETHVDRSIQGASEFVRTNVEGTYNLLNAAKEHGVEKFIHVSTDEVYGEVLQGAATEDWPFRPSSPYAASKAAGDCMAQAFYRTYGLPVVIVRPCNVFGPYQYPEKLIPFFVTRALRGEALPLYGDGRQTRQWTPVAWLCNAIAAILDRGEIGQAYNVAGLPMQNCDVAKDLLRTLGKPESLLAYVQDRPGHDRRYAVAEDKLVALRGECHRYGWSQFWNEFDDAVNWYAEHQDWCERRLEESKEYFDRQYGGAEQ